MNKAILTLAAIATATAVFAAAPAQAGGKHLNFGHPLGSFNASPHSSTTATQANYNKRQTSAAAKKSAARRDQDRRIAARKAAEKRAAQQRVAANQAKAHSAKNETKTATTWKAPVRTSAIAATNTLNFRAKTEPAQPVIEAATINAEPTEVAELECKRFIPSAGMTITVPCNP